VLPNIGEQRPESEMELAKPFKTNKKDVDKCFKAIIYYIIEYYFKYK